MVLFREDFCSVRIWFHKNKICGETVKKRQKSKTCYFWMFLRKHWQLDAFGIVFSSSNLTIDDIEK